MLVLYLKAFPSALGIKGFTFSFFLVSCLLCSYPCMWIFGCGTPLGFGLGIHESMNHAVDT